MTTGVTVLRTPMAGDNRLDEPMGQSDMQPVTITVDDARNISSLLLAPPRARALLRFSRMGRARHAHPFMQNVAVEAWRARRRYCCVISSLYGARLRRGRTLPARACDRSRRRGESRPAGVDASSCCRRQMAAAHDVAGAGRVPAGNRRPGPRLPRISTIRREPSDEQRQHLFDVQVPMLFLQGTRDLAGGSATVVVGDRTAGRARLAAAVRRRRPFLPRAALAPDERMPTSGASVERACGLGAVSINR